VPHRYPSPSTPSAAASSRHHATSETLREWQRIRTLCNYRAKNEWLSREQLRAGE